MNVILPTIRRTILPALPLLAAALWAATPGSLPGQSLMERALKLAKDYQKQKKSKAEPNAPKSASKPITGAFGLTFGQVLTPTRIVEVDEDSLSYQFTPNPPAPGLETYYVNLLPLTHRVGSIYAETAETTQEIARSTLATLMGKYGAHPAFTAEGSVQTWVWTDGQKELTMRWNPPGLILYYNSHELDEQGLAEMKRWKANPPPQTLGGPDYLKGIVLDGAFGARIGQVFPPPAVGTQMSDEGPYFNFQASNPIPGFDRYYVTVTPTSHKVAEIVAEAKGIAEANQERFVAHLVERFGPSTIMMPAKGSGRYCTWDVWEGGGLRRYLLAHIGLADGVMRISWRDIKLIDESKQEMAAGGGGTARPTTGVSKAQADAVKNELRLIDAAKDQLAIEFNLTSDRVPEWKNLVGYFKPGSRLATVGSPADPMGNPYRLNNLATPPQVSQRTVDAFREVCDLAYWSPFAP